ncbi:hypothetical protein I4U23_023355 [Adineta vaga]|nr:hypothetical protein I4U23_023355 [Adineta vaga]
MAMFTNIGRDVEANDRVENIFIIELKEKRLITVETEHDRLQSGLIRISSVNSFNEVVRKLKEDFNSWIPTVSPSEETNTVEYQQTQIIHIQFDDAKECINYIKSCQCKRVILLLYDHHANNVTILSHISKLPKEIRIYCCLESEPFADDPFESMSTADDIAETPIQTLDFAGLMVLVQISLINFLTHIQPSDSAMEDFIEFCEREYPIYKEHMGKFKTTYNSKNVLTWYTNPESCISRIVSRSCASLNLEVFSKVSFILRDMDLSVKEHHVKNLAENRFQSGFTVYRGRKICRTELNQFEKEEGFFVTRNFLSTSLNKNVSKMFAGEGLDNNDEVSALIRMRIEYIDAKSKAFASLYGNEGKILDEAEVILSMGMVFRVESCKQTGKRLKKIWKIRMVRGEEEARIEEHISKFLDRTVAGALCTFIGANVFQPLMNSNQPLNKTHASSIRNAEEPFNTVRNTNPYTQLSNNQPTETIVPNQQNNLGIFSTISGFMSSYPKTTVAIVTLGILIIIGSIVLPVVLRSKEPTRRPLTCSAVSSVQNPSSNYQVEHLDFNCSETLSNMTIIQIVQRTFNETHAQQYQTFWNYSTNMTFVENPTQIIYTWYSLPEAQFYYTPNSSRILGNDTYEIWAQSIYGDFFHVSGSF